MAEKPSVTELLREIQADIESIAARVRTAGPHLEYAQSILNAIGPQWAKLEAEAPDHPAVAATRDFFSVMRDEARRLARQTEEPLNSIQRYAVSIEDLGTATATTSASVVSGDVFFPSQIKVPPQVEFRESRTVKVLGSFDLTVGNLYSQVGQTFYGGGDEAPRAAMFIMRQCFDTFFDKLAPDDDVRNSDYFTPKSAGDPAAVTRLERITFAAHTHISDPLLRDHQIAGAKQLLTVYNDLNKAHKRGKLDRKTAEAALVQMQSMLKTWTESMTAAQSEETERTSQ